MVTPAVRLATPADAHDGALAQFVLLAETVDALPDEAFARPTRLGTWTVAELVAHLAANVEAVTKALALPPPDDRPTSELTYLASMREYAPGVAQRATELAAGVTPADLRARLHDGVAAAIAAVAPESLSRPLAVRLGTVSLGTFLATRCVEGVVHGLDLRVATGVPADPDPTALRVVVRSLAMLLLVTAPGRSVEVRIPGQLAVQCVEGPRHTRGTPANVVEADAVTFVELASGRLAFADAVREGRLLASGERADLTAYLPLIG